MYSISRIDGRLISVSMAAILSLALVGCDSSSSSSYNPCPDIPPLLSHEFDRGLTTFVKADSVLLMIGTDSEYRLYTSPPNVFVNASTSPDDSVRTQVHVVGRTRIHPTSGIRPGVVAQRWSGDTLQVWCGLYLPSSWPASDDKCSPAPSWLVPERVEITLPEGVGFRYIKEVGNWTLFE